MERFKKKEEERNRELERRIFELSRKVEEVRSGMCSPLSSAGFNKSTRSSVSSHECDREVEEIVKTVDSVNKMITNWMIKSHVPCFNI